MNQKQKIYILTVLLFIFAGIIVVAFTLPEIQPHLLAGFIIMPVLILTGILKSRYEKIDFGIRYLSSFLKQLFFWILITLGPLVLFHELSKFIIIQFSTGFQIVTFVAWGLLLSFTLMQISTEKNRKRLFLRLQEIGLFAPIIYSFNVLIIAVVFFSSISYVLNSHDLISFTLSPDRVLRPDYPIDLYVHFLDFFVWHFLDAVPLLKINQTLRWEEPLTYTKTGVGWVLLLFKITVIFPVIAAFAGYWAQKGQEVSNH